MARRSACRESLGLAPLLGLLVLGCGAAESGESRTLVFAAASLAESFEALGAAFEERHRSARVELHVAGTPELVLQLREGAPADVFASADEENMQRVTAAGVELGEPAIFARNRLALVVARGNPKSIAGLADWTRSDLTVALCAPGVPAGRYARLALKRAGLPPRSVSDEPSVRALLSKVELGELDAGIVYATDTRAAALRVDAVEIPDELNVSAAYPIASVARGGSPAAGPAFVRFVLSPDGQRLLRSFGFEAP